VPIDRHYFEAYEVGPSGLRTNWFATVGFSTAVDPGTPNPDLNDPLADMLDDLGIPAVDPSLVADSDLATIPPLQRRRALLYFDIHVLEKILGNFSRVDTRALQEGDNANQFAERVRKTLADLRDQAKEMFGEPGISEAGTSEAGATPMRIPGPGCGPDGLWHLRRGRWSRD
jgi:hypothetical protein